MSAEIENNGFEIEIKIEIKNSDEPDIDEMNADQLREYAAAANSQRRRTDGSGGATWISPIFCS